MFAVQAGQQVMSYQQQVQGVNSRNRARLKQFDYQNDNYLVETMLNNNKWKNDVIVQQDETDKVFDAMVNQWQQYDEQLDQLFANADFKLQDSLVKMYKNSYAGEGTGVTAGRMAAQSVREHGYRVAEETNKLILAQKEVDVKRDATRIDANYKINNLFEQVRFAPIPGQTPIPPTLEAKPSMAGLVLGLASSAISAYGFHKMTAATATGMTPVNAYAPGAVAPSTLPSSIYTTPIGGAPSAINPSFTSPFTTPPSILPSNVYTQPVGVQLWR